MGETEDYDKSATPTSHAPTHEAGGSDEIIVEDLTGELADEQLSSWAKVSGKPSTFTPEAHKTSHQDGGSDEISVAGLSGLLADDQHVLDSEVLTVAAAITHGSTHLPGGTDPIASPKFSAHKNGVNQTAIPTAGFTKITFPTEEYDVGGTYDAVNSKWIPGIIGKVHITACVLWSAAADQTELDLAIYKNGVLYKLKLFMASGTSYQGDLMTCDAIVTAITDYFEVYVYQISGSDKIVLGNKQYTWFEGHILT